MATRIGILLTASTAIAAIAFYSYSPNTNIESQSIFSSSSQLSTLEFFSCSQAQTILYSKGYRDIKTMDCNGSQYRFSALRKNKEHIITLSAFSGGMVALQNQDRSFASRKSTK